LLFLPSRSVARGLLSFDLFSLFSSKLILLVETLQLALESFNLLVLHVNLLLLVVELAAHKHVRALNSVLGNRPCYFRQIVESFFERLLLHQVVDLLDMIDLLDQLHIFFQNSLVFLFKIPLVVL